MKENEITSLYNIRNEFAFDMTYSLHGLKKQSGSNTI